MPSLFNCWWSAAQESHLHDHKDMTYYIYTTCPHEPSNGLHKYCSVQISAGYLPVLLLEKKSIHDTRTSKTGFLSQLVQ